MDETQVVSEQLTKALDEYEKAMHPLWEWAYDGNMKSERFAHFMEYAELMRRMILLREAIQKQSEDYTPF